MPAPAGSKGPLVPVGRRPDDTQEYNLARALWLGEATAEDVERELAGHRLETLSCETNSACPLNCVYCYLNARPPARPLKLETLARVLEDAIDFGTRRIAFVGKEPFADERAMALIERLSARRDRGNFQLGCVTNGYFLARFTDRLARVLLDYLDVSLDGPADVHDRIRGHGSFARAATAIAFLAESKTLTLIVSTVLHRANLNRLEAFVLGMRRIGVRFFHFSPVLDLAPGGVAELEVTVEHLFGPVWEQVTRAVRGESNCQVVVELPVEWAWLAVQVGLLPFTEIQADDSGALYWQPELGVPLFYKVYLLPQDCWRWARITSDGFYLGALRAAASPDYRELAAGHVEVDGFQRSWSQSFGKQGWFVREWNRCIDWVKSRAGAEVALVRG